MPHLNDVEFFLWWQQAGDRISAGALRGFNTLVVLGAWTIWRTRNDAVFDRIALVLIEPSCLHGMKLNFGC